MEHRYTNSGPDSAMGQDYILDRKDVDGCLGPGKDPDGARANAVTNFAPPWWKTLRPEGPNYDRDD